MAAPTPLLKGFEKIAAQAKPDPAKRVLLADPDTRGLFLRITPKGAKSWTIVVRDPEGKQVWAFVGSHGEKSLADVRAKAKEGVQRIRQGQEAFPKPKKSLTFNEVADIFIRLHVKKEGLKEPALRSAPAIERQFRDFLRPAWGKRPFADIGGNDITELLRKISVERGSVMSNRVHSTITTLFRFQAPAMPGDWRPPLMPKKTKERPAERVLFDDEQEKLADKGRDLRLLWKAAEQAGAFGAFVRLLLLTAQRRAKVATMKWDDISEDGVWTIPSEDGEKGNADRLRLPPMAHEIIKALPRVEKNPHVFPGRGKSYMQGFSPLKVALDKKIAEANDGKPIAAWVLHDLRRTAKTMMTAAGVLPHVSEKVLGHKLQGILKPYDRAKMPTEKADALVKLAGLVDLIVNPPSGNVVKMKGRKRG